MHYSFYVVKHVPFQKTQRHEKTFAVEHRAFKHLNFPVVAHSVTCNFCRITTITENFSWLESNWSFRKFELEKATRFNGVIDWMLPNWLPIYASRTWGHLDMTLSHWHCLRLWANAKFEIKKLAIKILFISMVVLRRTVVETANKRTKSLNYNKHFRQFKLVLHGYDGLTEYLWA